MKCISELLWQKLLYFFVSGRDECLRKPCGINAKCTETSRGFECVCEAGCRGDAYQGCVCDVCEDMQCGINAACRLYENKPQCYCPPNFSSGDPLIACKFYSILN